jgi:hypothetical protein
LCEALEKLVGEVELESGHSPDSLREVIAVSIVKKLLRIMAKVISQISSRQAFSTVDICRSSMLLGATTQQSAART